MKWFLWICLWLGLGVECTIGGLMIWYGRKSETCLAIGLLFLFPIRDTVKALRLVPWKCYE